MTNIPLFLASDNNYAPYVASTIASFCDNTKSFIDFYVLDGGISKENQEKIKQLSTRYNNFSLEFITIDLDKEFPNFKETDKITRAMYNRYLIPYVKPELDKALYSDVDVIATGDIAEMFAEDLGSYAMGAIYEDFGEGKLNNKRREYMGLSENHKYFSSGNLILNCKKWRDDKILDNLLKIAVEYAEVLRYPDQDTLNKYFDCNYKVLPAKYCYTDAQFDFAKNNADDMIIRHYTGDHKPWKLHPSLGNISTPNNDLFWHYIKQTAFYEEAVERTEHKNLTHFKMQLRIQEIARKNRKNV